MYHNASPFKSNASGPSSALSGLYHQVGIETSVSTATPHTLVKLLFDGFFDAAAQARGAIETGNIPLKAKSLSKALAIVDEGLKSNLDMKAGGEVAISLHRLYEYIGLRLTQVNLRNDLAALDECLSLMTPIRESWNMIAPKASNALPQGGYAA
jgi:flagellar secretion chaperone FliS